MRIALVHRKYSRTGGVEKNVTLLAEGFAARGHDVTVVCRGADTEPPPGVRMEIVPTRGLTIAQKYESFARRSAEWLRDPAQRDAFDVVQGFDLTYEQDVLRLGRGVIKVYREVLDTTRSSLDRWLRARTSGSRRLLELEERMVAAPGLLVTNSRTTRQELMDAYGVPPERIETILNGIDLERFGLEEARAGRAETRQRFGIPGDVPCILYVGTGFRRKGLDTLLHAAARTPAHVLVVGRDGAMRKYRALAGRLGMAERVRFAGSQPVSSRLYGAGDVLALPSRYEPFSNVVLEALASGLPAIHPRTGGAAEALENGLDDLVIEKAEDVEALTAVLTRVLESPPSPERCRAVAEKFPEERCIERYEALYERLVNSEQHSESAP